MNSTKQKQVLNIKNTTEIHSGQGHDGRQEKTHIEYDPVLPLGTSNTEFHIPLVDAQSAFQKVHHDANPLSIVSGMVTHSCYCPLSFHCTL